MTSSRPKTSSCARQLAEAQAQAREGQEAIAENERYRDLLGFTQRHTDFELEPANVVSYGASNWSSTLHAQQGQRQRHRGR